MKPAVRFECETCGWMHHAPDERIAIVEGIPRADYIPFHECEGGASVLERSSFDVELRTQHPGQNVKITL